MISYGGKADSLLKLKENGINVPDFFIVSQDTFIEFLKFNGLIDKVKKLYEDKSYVEIKNLIKNGQFADDLKSKILSDFTKLGSKEVSVRSSASNEDGKDKSFAGQYNTFLNVTENCLFDNIKNCWCSLYDNNILEYNEDANIFGMNVVVQKMIDADYAGVAFSIDPTDDKNNYTVIEMVNGLGESLVSGERTPSKFLVRRQTERIDLKIGEIDVDDEIVINLEKKVLDIEKIYGLPVDIEYAIKDNEIFILQTRPISKLTRSIKPFKLSITRPHSIIEQEIYFAGEYEGIKNITKGLYYFKPLFIYNQSHETVEIYYNYMDLEEDPYLIYKEMDNSYDDLVKHYNIAIENLNIIKEKIKGDEIDLKEIKEMLITIYPFSSLGQLAGHFDNMSQRVKDLLLEYRNEYDSFIHDICLTIEDKIKSGLKDEYKDYISYITLNEIIEDKLPSLDILDKRKKGYIYFGKLYENINYDDWLKENNISIVNDDEDEDLKGQIAYSESVSGRVCKVFSEKDFAKFQEGDILVTPMTVPKFIEVIKKAKGIITDEGGITCHASIVAREMQIACIVGCKNATKILNDGDYVEIDGSTGIIKKIDV